jgi:peptide-methionine (S)-S-oxide reductase
MTMRIKKIIPWSLLMSGILPMACSRAAVDVKNFPAPVQDLAVASNAGPQSVVLAGGCFWCTEGVFENVPGVTDVVSGYAGGTDATANYEAVCSGSTDHAEVIRVTYDPTKITFGQVLKLFFSVAHDPTTLNRQGADRGRQYRSAVFFADEDQKRVAEAYIRQLDSANVFGSPIVTTLEPLTKFYAAEGYHQDYVKLHPNNPYIVYNALPKIEKLKSVLEKQDAMQPHGTAQAK